MICVWASQRLYNKQITVIFVVAERLCRVLFTSLVLSRTVSESREFSISDVVYLLGMSECGTLVFLKPIDSLQENRAEFLEQLFYTPFIC